MRDPERIEIILDRLGKVWKEYPDFRLCQLLFNVVSKYQLSTSYDIFYVEDDGLLKAIESVIESDLG